MPNSVLHPTLNVMLVVEKVIAFANLSLQSPDDVVELFTEAWEIEDPPRLSECRRAQADLRNWLSDTIENKATIDGFIFAALKHPGGVAFNVTPEFAFGMIDDGKTMKFEINWKYEVIDGSLRGICALAVAYLYAEDLLGRLKRCARPAYENHQACQNVLLALTRTDMKYCKDPECENIHGAMRTAKSRGGGNHK